METKLLNSDEKEALAEIIDQDGIKCLLKILEAQVANFEKDVLSVDIKPGREQELVVAKARSEGARRLANKFSVEIVRLRQILLNEQS